MSTAKKLTYAKKELQKTNKKEETTMITKLAKLLSPSRRKEEGFTLIELLIVVAIIAILAAIAIPQFSAYRQRGLRATMVADAKNAATMMETLFTDCNSYVVSLNATGTGPGTANLGQGAVATTTNCPGSVGTTLIYNTNISKSNTIKVTAATATAWTLTVDQSAAYDNVTYTGALAKDNTGKCAWNNGAGAVSVTGPDATHPAC